MKNEIKTPKQALSRAYLKQKPERQNIELFKNELIAVLDKVNDTESEEFHKNLIISFLNSVYYKNKHYINTKGRNDLVIHNRNDADSSVGVLIEVKKPTNRTEMVSKSQLNVKSFQELLLYYLRERKTAKNFELKYLIITNINEWFVFDAQDFERLFYKNTALLKHFDQFEAKTLSGTSTDFFYKDVAAPEIEKIKDEIAYTHFDIRDYNSILRNKDKEDDKKLIALYKFLSPTHLLKRPFANDYNQLNKEFYAELLHIMGLKEIKEKGQKFIVRKPADERDNGSIIENAINELDAMDKLRYVPNSGSYGKTTQEQLFGVALDLCITWINRILFLKLLEAQIIKYNKGDAKFAFLSGELIEGYDDLNSLFFQILARKEEDRRDGYLKDRFSHVPYLNSSLFEQTELETKTIVVSNLQDKAQIKPYAKSVLKSKNKISQNLKPLEYLLSFLDAYDFSSEGSEDIQEENKALISASVLGLIFEKINGYKDGSFFTPSFVTMFMCRQAISASILQKFNQAKGWTCKTIKELYNKIDDIDEANRIINSLKLCDPAVGSGHFLVSSLNEIIYLKSELGVLTDREGKRLRDYKITIENDELIVSDVDFGIFKYNPHNSESQRVQEALFHEKQSIIENSLFGVDINPNSVKICQLRLWIELLKHTYYIPSTNRLETLPNIDINIKCGNSLVSRFAIDENMSASLKKLKINIADYRLAVSQYRNAASKEDKRKLEEYITRIKTDLKTEIYQNHPLKKTLSQKRGKLDAIGQKSIFDEENNKRGANKERKKLEAEIKKLETKLYEIESNKIYRNAFEWRVEFPEVLDNEGTFIGFDTIIGNPPYIQLQSIREATDVYKQMDYLTFERTGDIYSLFYELGNDLLRAGGNLSYITSNKWMRAAYGAGLRRYIVDNTNPSLLIDFAGIKVFDEATVDVNILSFDKAPNKGKTCVCQIKQFDTQADSLEQYLATHATQSAFVADHATDSFVILSDTEQAIKTKVEQAGKPLKEWDIQIYRGILTGYNEAFIIDGKTKDELIARSAKNAEIIRPILRGRDIKRYGYEFADLWLICTFPSLHIDIDEYPDIRDYLLTFGFDRLKQTGDKNARKKTNNKWFETQDTIAYWQDFSKEKIVYPNMTKFLPFYLDKSGFYQNDKSFMIVGEKIAFLSAFFNSSLFKYCYKENFPELLGGTRELRKVFFEKISVIEVDENTNTIFKEKVEEIQQLKQAKEDTRQLEIDVDRMIFDLYDLSQEERDIIGFIQL